MEVQIEVPTTGTKLTLDADRQFEGQPGDSVLRVQGQNPDGGQVFDAAYVEVSAEEAQALAKLVRSIVSPDPELTDTITTEIQAAFSSKLGGRDAKQITEIGMRASKQQVAQWIGGKESLALDTLEHLSERFERAAAKRRNPPAYSSGNGESQPSSSKNR